MKPATKSHRPNRPESLFAAAAPFAPLTPFRRVRLALVIFSINDVLGLWESEAQEEHSSIEVISE